MKSIEAEFLDHENPTRVMYEGWEKLLSKYFQRIPNIRDGGYTSFYYFEFDNGTLTMRRNLRDENPVTHEYFNPLESSAIKEQLLRDLFGDVSLENASFSDMLVGPEFSLSLHPLKILSQAKISSLSGKYFSIPAEYLPYYPPVEHNDGIRSVTDFAIARGIAAAPVKKPGRPKQVKAEAEIKGSQSENKGSILNFLEKKTYDSTNTSIGEKRKLEPMTKSVGSSTTSKSQSMLMNWLGKIPPKIKKVKTCETASSKISGDKTPATNNNDGKIGFDIEKFLSYYDSNIYDYGRPDDLNDGECSIVDARSMESRMLIYNNGVAERKTQYALAMEKLIESFTVPQRAIFLKKNDHSTFILEIQNSCSCYIHALHCLLNMQALPMYLAGYVIPSIACFMEQGKHSMEDAPYDVIDVVDLPFKVTTLKDSMIAFRIRMNNLRPAMDTGFSPSALHCLLSGLNPPRPDIINIEYPTMGIYLGAKRIATPRRISAIIEKLGDANAAIIFYDGKGSIGHFTCVWEEFFTTKKMIPSCAVPKKYLYYDSINRSIATRNFPGKPFDLYGPCTPDVLDKQIPPSSSFLNASIIILHLFKLPLLKSSRDIEIKKGLVHLQARANYIFKEYLHLHEFGVTFPVSLFPTIDY